VSDLTIFIFQLRGRVACRSITLRARRLFEGFGVCFFVGGFWNAPDACVNGGVFRQDEREGQDALRVGFGQLQRARGRIAY